MSITTNRAVWFLTEIVQPTVDEFLDDVRNVRKAMLASMAVSSLADHIHHACPELRGGRDIRAFREHLAKRDRNFAIVRDVADATKHVRLDRRSATVRKVEDIQLGELWLYGDDGRPITNDDGKPLVNWSAVSVMLPDGTEEWLDEHIREALSFLRVEIASMWLVRPTSD